MDLSFFLSFALPKLHTHFGFTHSNRLNQEKCAGLEGGSSVLENAHQDVSAVVPA